MRQLRVPWETFRCRRRPPNIRFFFFFFSVVELFERGCGESIFGYGPYTFMALHVVATVAPYGYQLPGFHLQ